ACRTSSAGGTTPSERVVWVWRSIVDGAGGSTRPEPVGANGSWRRRRGAAVMSRLDEPLDPLDGESTAGRRIDVDLDGIEDDGPLAHLEARRQGVDEARDDRPRLEADDAPDRACHAEVGLVGGAVREDPLVTCDDVRVGAHDHAHAAVEVETERVLLRGQLAVEIDDADRRQRL